MLPGCSLHSIFFFLSFGLVPVITNPFLIKKGEKNWCGWAGNGDVQLIFWMLCGRRTVLKNLTLACSGKAALSLLEELVAVF